MLYVEHTRMKFAIFSFFCVFGCSNGFQMLITRTPIRQRLYSGLERNHATQLDKSKLLPDDLIIFSSLEEVSDAQHLQVGVICEKGKKLYPLCCKESCLESEVLFVEPDRKSVELNLFHDEESSPINLDDKSISIFGSLREYQFSQRMIEDRISNPHGEHAEDMWIVQVCVNKSMIQLPSEKNKFLLLPLILSEKWIIPSGNVQEMECPILQLNISD